MNKDLKSAIRSLHLEVKKHRKSYRDHNNAVTYIKKHYADELATGRPFGPLVRVYKRFRDSERAERRWLELFVPMLRHLNAIQSAKPGEPGRTSVDVHHATSILQKMPELMEEFAKVASLAPVSLSVAKKARSSKPGKGHEILSCAHRLPSGEVVACSSPFDEAFRQRAEALGLDLRDPEVLLEIEDGFVDRSGQFIAPGPSWSVAAAQA